MSRLKSIARHWKRFFSPMIWTAIFSTLSDNFKLFAVNNDKILQLGRIAKAFHFHGFLCFNML